MIHQKMQGGGLRHMEILYRACQSSAASLMATPSLRMTKIHVRLMGLASHDTGVGRYGSE
jgi:hypothetical protein